MLTWKEVKERQACGEQLRWVPKSLSGLPVLCEMCKRKQHHMLHSNCDVRDLFLGKQRLTESEENAFGGGMQETLADGSILVH